MVMRSFFKRIADALKSFRWGYVLIALLDTALALLLFVFGHDALDYLAIAIGITVILAAAVLCASALAARERGFGFGLKIVLSVCLATSGIATLIARGGLIGAIISIIGLVMIIDGSFKLSTSADSKRYSHPAWWILLALSLLLIAGGYMTVRSSGFEGKLGYVLLGILLLADGVANLLSAFYLGFNGKRAESEIVDKYTAEALTEGEERQAALGDSAEERQAALGDSADGRTAEKAKEEEN